MNLQAVIKRYKLNVGDEVICIRPHRCGVFEKNSVHTLVTHTSGKRLTLLNMPSYVGDVEGGAQFAMYKRKHTFVRSMCENTEANQKALFELGYRWSGDNNTAIKHLTDKYLFTNLHGLLSVGTYNANTPVLFDFVVEPLPEHLENERQNLIANIKESEDYIAQAKARLDEEYSTIVVAVPKVDNSKRIAEIHTRMEHNRYIINKTDETITRNQKKALTCCNENIALMEELKELTS